ncbi:hypothetical protein BLX87_17425 [Bacillus sp. VT-16-64]|nr:hypothetical protein BLX87_17425 [Bacillus sp. VT-16-64]
MNISGKKPFYESKVEFFLTINYNFNGKHMLDRNKIYASMLTERARKTDHVPEKVTPIFEKLTNVK